MNLKCSIFLLISIGLFTCESQADLVTSDTDKRAIQESIQKEIDTLILAVNTEDIDLYMKKMPVDFLIYDEHGDVISREQQKKNVLRDWSIIDRTISNSMIIDSIDYVSRDSIYVYTSQRWERIMFQRDGITTDTVVTTQKHKELWKKRNSSWIGYDVVELGGEIFINGKAYDPN